MTDFEMFRAVFKKIDPKNEFSCYHECCSRKEIAAWFRDEFNPNDSFFKNVDKYIGVGWGGNDERNMFFDESGTLLFVDDRDEDD